MKESFGLHSVTEPLPHPEQAAVGAVHAEQAADAIAAGHRLPVREGAGRVRVESHRAQRSECTVGRQEPWPEPLAGTGIADRKSVV